MNNLKMKRKMFEVMNMTADDLVLEYSDIYLVSKIGSGASTWAKRMLEAKNAFENDPDVNIYIVRRGLFDFAIWVDVSEAKAYILMNENNVEMLIAKFKADLKNPHHYIRSFSHINDVLNRVTKNSAGEQLDLFENEGLDLFTQADAERLGYDSEKIFSRIKMDLSAAYVVSFIRDGDTVAAPTNRAKVQLLNSRLDQLDSYVIYRADEEQVEQELVAVGSVSESKLPSDKIKANNKGLVSLKKKYDI
ncbi:DUF5986 family protein [Weissella confusa]|uniref:DUF5986 family protein n=1 Tax=Weissella confusa TaxID=1583 RepID=UPI0022FEF5FD|nr:DUF5986 family protein [Weissella confusa]MDA5457568.1 hypothetical protein [Weissella confusa]